MQDALKQLVLSNQLEMKIVSSHTLNALLQRRLIDASGVPTEPGIVAGLSVASLEQQCQFLGIEKVEVELSKKYEDPAVDAMYYFESRGNRCSYCEGAVLRKILFCLYFHKLSDLTKEGWKYYMEGLSTYPLAVGLGLLDFQDYIKDYDNIENRLFKIIAKADRQTFLTNYRRLFGKGFCWFGADEIFAGQVFDKLGIGRLAAISRVILTDPYAFGKGWPDLTVLGDEEVQFIEVKTTDRLTISQLITIPAMIESAGIRVKVLQISRRNREHPVNN